MRVKWSEKKSELCKQKRGYSFDEIKAVFDNEIGGNMICDDPEQFICVGFLGQILMSVIFEYRVDQEGDYLWIVTYWNTTESEKRRFHI